MVVVPFLSLALSQAPNFTNAPQMDLNAALSYTSGTILEPARQATGRPDAAAELSDLLDFFEVDPYSYIMWRGHLLIKEGPEWR